MVAHTLENGIKPGSFTFETGIFMDDEKKPPVLRDWFYELGKQRPRLRPSVLEIIKTAAFMGEEGDSERKAFSAALLIVKAAGWARRAGIDVRSALGIFLSTDDPVEADYRPALDASQLDVRAVPASEVKPEPEKEAPAVDDGLRIKDPLASNERYRVEVYTHHVGFVLGLNQADADGLRLHSLITRNSEMMAVFERKET